MILHMYNNLTKSDICCLIISYNPDDNIFQLIKTLEHQVAYLIIVDNNSREDKRIALSEFIKSREVKLIINNTNRGVAAALNQGIHEAKLNKYKWIITFDQDTKSSNRIIEYICRHTIAQRSGILAGTICMDRTCYVREAIFLRDYCGR